MFDNLQQILIVSKHSLLEITNFHWPNQQLIFFSFKHQPTEHKQKRCRPLVAYRFYWNSPKRTEDRRTIQKLFRNVTYINDPKFSGR